MVEIINQILENMVRTRGIVDSEDLESNWTGVILAAVYGM